MLDLTQHSPEWWVAFFTIAGGSYYYGLRPLFKFIHRAISLAPVLSSADKALARIEEEIGLIKAEVKTNHGGSLKDAVKRIESRTEAIEQMTNAQTVSLTAQIRGVKATALQAQRAATRAEKIATQSLEIVARK